MQKGSEVTALRNEANKAKIQGDVRHAIECLERIYDLDPEDPNNAKELGSLYNKTGNKRKAVEYYWKALEKYREAEYYSNATAIAQMLLRFGEDDLLVKHELAFLYEKQGLLGDAVSAYEELAELYKSEGDIEGVLENLKKIVDITPKKIGIRIKLSEIYENQNKNDEAIAELKEIRDIYNEQGRVEDVEEIELRINNLASGVVGVSGITKEVREEIKEKVEEIPKVKEHKEEKVPEEMVVEFEQEGIGLIEATEEVIEKAEEEKEPVGETLFDDTEGLFDMGGEEEKEEEPELQQVDIITGVEDTKEEEPELQQLDVVKEIEDTRKEDIEVSVSGWEDWINLAELYESVGSTEESLTYYNKAAEANFNKKNYDGAYDIYRKITELDTLSIISRQKMIQSALKLNSREKAIESYSSLYECLKRKKADEAAVKILDKIENIDPNADILQEIKGGKRKATAKKKADTKVSLDFEELFEAEVSEVAEVKEEAEEKAPSLETLLNEFKKKAKEELGLEDYAAHFNLGITYKEMDLIEEAIDEFKKAMKEKSWRLKSLEMLGLCHELIDEDKRAEDIYNMVIKTKNFRDDEKPAFLYHLGNLYARQRNFSGALKQYKRIIEIDQDFADVKQKIEILNKKMSGKEVEEEISFHFGEVISDEGADLWDSVLSGEEEKAKQESLGGKTEKRRGKISYI
jgi:tetratricopeptide (TPR) repeat protein